MTPSASSEILRVNQLEGRHFNPISFQIESGTGALIVGRKIKSLTELIDITFGLDRAMEGSVHFPDDEKRDKAHQAQTHPREIGFCSIAADMLSNLRIWENLILPTQVRATKKSVIEIDSLEQQIIEAFTAAGFDRSWIAATLPSPPDRLSNFEKVVCGLIRSHLTGFTLLVCENIFAEVDHDHAIQLNDFLNWIGTRHPDSGLLVVHHGVSEPRLPGLTAWKPIKILKLDEKP